MTDFTWPSIISSLIVGENLSRDQAIWAMDEIMGGDAEPAQIAGFLTALATKGETTEEILGLANSMQAHAVSTNITPDSLDIVGTGGDRLNTVNISLMASIVIAAGGVKVVKHGNRASSSKSGSADCLEALGFDMDLDIPAIERIFDEIGIAFLFANKFHPSMRFVSPVRRSLGVATAFNILGPLTNPAKSRTNIIGVSAERFAPIVAEVLARRGARAFVFRGDNGLDELSTVAINNVWEIRDGEISFSRLDAVAELGFRPATVDELRGADATYNAGIVREILDGKEGAIRDAVVLNAAVAFVADGKLDGMRPQDGDLRTRMQSAVSYAQQVIDDGRARDFFSRWKDLAQELA